MKNQKLFLFYELLGIPIIFLVATILHFIYPLSNYATWSTFIGSVNESIWEHIKIFIIPYILYSCLELIVLKPPFKQFVVAKVISSYLITILTTVLFYVYTSITSRPILAVDILNSLLTLIICFTVSYTFTLNFPKLKNLFFIALTMLYTLLIMLMLFTAAPPHLDIFCDPNTFNYGIPITSFNDQRIYPNARKI